MWFALAFEAIMVAGVLCAARMVDKGDRGIALFVGAMLIIVPTVGLIASASS